MAYKDYELIDVPSYSSSWHLSIVTFKFGILMFGLSFEVFPHVQKRVINEGESPVSSFLYHFRRYLFFANAKERFILKVIPEDTDARHLFIEDFHVGHQLLTFFVCKLSHHSLFLSAKLQKFFRIA